MNSTKNVNLSSVIVHLCNEADKIRPNYEKETGIDFPILPLLMGVPANLPFFP